MPSPPYRDPELPPADRVEDLVGRMELREKLAQLVGISPGVTDQSADEVAAAVAGHGVGTVSPTAVAVDRDTGAVDVARFVNAVQRAAVEETRLGIPALTTIDAVHGHAFVTGTTVFPHRLGMAATRDPDLVRRAARVTAREMRATGLVQNYAPTGDVARDPRWGRTFETYGESPRLAARLVGAEVRGYQDDPPADERVAATVKHFPAYGEPVRGQDTAPVDRSPAHRRRAFLPPFEAAVDAGVDAVMPCYNAIDGEPVHASGRYLRDLLRGDLGSRAVTVSDWNGVAQLHEDHCVARSPRDAVAMATDAGLDVASVGGLDHLDRLEALVESGELGEDRIAESLRRVLRLKVDLGLFEDPLVDVATVEHDLRTDGHREVARTAARRSLTLLDDGALPFGTDVDSVAVVGPNADDADATCGGWTGSLDGDATTVLEGVEAVVGDGTEVTHERGAGVRERGDIEAARATAADADVAVVVLGEEAYIHEFVPDDFGQDHVEAFPARQHLRLPAAQREVLAAVSGTGTPTALVLVTGRPLAVPEATEYADAALLAYYPGGEGGLAVAEVLFGGRDPGGRLPVSVPRSAGHLPTRFDHQPHPTPLGDWSHPPAYDPLYPFGHGLSYAAFAVEASVAPATVSPGGEVTVTVDIENVADRPGREALDVFVRDEVSSRVTPTREWHGTAAATLDPGERATREVAVDAADLGVVYPEGRRDPEPGEFTVLVGSAGAPVATGTFEVSGRG